MPQPSLYFSPPPIASTFSDFCVLPGSLPHPLPPSVLQSRRFHSHPGWWFTSSHIQLGLAQHSWCHLPTMDTTSLHWMSQGTPGFIGPKMNCSFLSSIFHQNSSHTLTAEFNHLAFVLGWSFCSHWNLPSIQPCAEIHMKPKDSSNPHHPPSPRHHDILLSCWNRFLTCLSAFTLPSNNPFCVLNSLIF